MKSFYSTFKGADEYLRFVLLTEVTKFSEVSVFSGFNQPKDISMDERSEALCGITQDELGPFQKADHRMISFLSDNRYLFIHLNGIHLSKNMVLV